MSITVSLTIMWQEDSTDYWKGKEKKQGVSPAVLGVGVGILLVLVILVKSMSSGGEGKITNIIYKQAL